MKNQVCPKTWLTESILVTLFCCLPFGVMSIIHASKVSTFFAMGNYDMAQKASANAAKWIKISFFTGLIATLIYLFIYLAIFVTFKEVPIQ